MEKTNCTVYFVSDSTGVTAESFGSSLLSQFPDVDFIRHHKPFLDTPEEAQQLAEEFKSIRNETGVKPLVFATLPDPEISEILQSADCHYYELFTPYVKKISENLGVTPTHQTGTSHGLVNHQSYDDRMDIVNFALLHDDAMTMKNLPDADVILIGVSRSGKTPTCLYLALHFGIRAANYPLTEDDFLKDDLPQILKEHKDKLVGLTISPQRLAEIREKRRAGSSYAALAQCKKEVNHARELFSRYRLPIFDTTASSIEELAAKIIQVAPKKT